jgi:cellulose synthase/poly-beta-1,6-N-acetylglucosamine synthase-like glycosyltransferase
VLNALRALPDLGEVLLLTDANVLFERDLLKRLVPRLLQPGVGVVSAFVLHRELSRRGIAVQESQYITRENTMKYQEGLLWGAMMGAFGACYAIRRELFPRLPANFLMEDFFVSMHVLNAGFQAVSEPTARCFEDLPGSMQQEFRRKVRISTGNFQNLMAWKALLWPPSGISFSFFSHKIIRWKGPFLLIACLLASAVLAGHSPFYLALFLLQVLLMLSSLLDQGLSRLGIRVGALRLIGYFYTMNLALLVGFFKYLQGVQNSAWQPTARNSTHV